MNELEQWKQLSEAKDRIIEQLEEQKELLKELAESRATLLTGQDKIIGQQRCRTAELEYHIHQHDLLYEHPWQYFVWRIFVWPFHPNNKS